MKAKLILLTVLALAGLVGGVATYAALDCSDFDCRNGGYCSTYPEPRPTLTTRFR